MLTLPTQRKDDSSTHKYRKSMIWKQGLVTWKAAVRDFHLCSFRQGPSAEVLLESVMLYSSELRGESFTRKIKS